MAHPFSEGDRVLVKTRKGKRVIELVGTFQGMVTKARAAVLVWDRTGTATLDDEGERVVALQSLAPYHSEQSDDRHRARHAARLYKQGVRYYKVGHADGKTFVVETLDAVRDIAVGRVLHRKTVQIIATADLWPMRY